MYVVPKKLSIVTGGLLAFLCLVVPSVSAASVDQVKISEFMPDPAAVTDASGEWVELYNDTDEEINLTGWKINGSTINAGVAPAKGYAVVCKNDNFETNGGVVCNGKASFSLTNSGGSVSLNQGTVVIDSIGYTAANVSSGKSIINTNGSLTNETFSQYGSGDFGTPGYAPPSDITRPETILHAPLHNSIVNGQVEIRGSITDENIKDYSVVIRNSADNSIVAQHSQELIESVDNQVLYTWDSRLVGANGTFVITLEATDKSGNVATLSSGTNQIGVTTNNDFSLPSISARTQFPKTILRTSKAVQVLAADEQGIATVSIKYSQNEFDSGWLDMQLKPIVKFPNRYISKVPAGLTDGNYKVTLRAIDVNGNVSEQVVENVVVDNTSPNLLVTNPTPSSTVSGTVNINGEANDVHLKNCSVQIFKHLAIQKFKSIDRVFSKTTKATSEALSGSLASWDSTTVENGDYDLRVTCVDAAGNKIVNVVPIMVQN